MVRVALHQARYDMLSLLRNRQARYATLLMPVLLLVALLAAFGDNVVGPGHTTASSYYVPGIATLAILAGCFMNLVISLVTEREAGVLKRRRATPAPAPVVIAGRTITAVAAALVTVVAVFVVAAAAYGVEPPAGALPGAAVTAVVGSIAFCGMAYALASAIRSADAAQPIVQAISLPLYFSSGIFIPSVSLPRWLHDAASLLPVEHLSHGLDRAFQGGAFAWGDLAVVAGWGVAGVAIALSRFRWTPVAVNA